MSEKKCNRTACAVALLRGYYRIWNDPSRTEPNVYCPRCGRRIVEANAGLRYERVTPDGDVLITLTGKAQA